MRSRWTAPVGGQGRLRGMECTEHPHPTFALGPQCVGGERVVATWGAPGGTAGLDSRPPSPTPKRCLEHLSDISASFFDVAEGLEEKTESETDQEAEKKRE